MANGQDTLPDIRQWYDPEWAEGPRRRYIDQPPRYEHAQPGPWASGYKYPEAAAPGPEVLPTTEQAAAREPLLRRPRVEGGAGWQPTPPPEMPGQYQQLRDREAELYAGVHPVRKHGWGRFGQVMGTIGQDIGNAMFPQMMENIPGTKMQMGRELYNTREQLQRQEQLELEREKMGLPTIMGPEWTPKGPNEEPLGTTVHYAGHGLHTLPVGSAIPANWADFAKMYPEEAARETGMPTTPAKPTAPAAEGALPTIPQQPQGGPPAKTGAEQPPAPMMTPTPPAAPQAKTPVHYGTLAPGQRQMTPEEIQQENAANQEYWNRLEPKKPYPQTITLGPNATENDAARVQQMLRNMESAGRMQQGQDFNQQMALDRKQREDEAQALRQQAADEKMVHAVDNNNRVHYMSQGDFNAHQDNFHPHPFTLAPGEYQKALESATRVNEMQARMNGMAEAAREFNWKDSGQMSIVSQLVNTLNQPSWIGRTLGVDPMRWLSEQFMNKPGAEGATPETRNYIANLLSLREAMLALPKEITEGSRMTEQGVGALYATLPQGWTPNYAWAITQLRLTQAILDRDRGTKVPIIDGMREDKKIPLLYRFSATTKDGKQFFSDDKREWFDINGDRVERPR